MDDGRVGKYQDWIGHLEAQRAKARRDRKKLPWVVIGGALLAPVGLFWSPWICLAIFFVACSLFGVGFYLASMWDWDYTHQIDEANRDLQKLRQKP